MAAYIQHGSAIAECRGVFYFNARYTPFGITCSFFTIDIHRQQLIQGYCPALEPQKGKNALVYI